MSRGTMGLPSKDLCFTIIDDSTSRLETVQRDDPRSQHYPFRFVDTRTGRLKELWEMPPNTEYGSFSHVWCKQPDREITWDKLSDTSVTELQSYLGKLKESYDELISICGEPGMTSDQDWTEQSMKIEPELKRIEEEFRIPFRIGGAEGAATKEIVSNLLKKIRNDLRFQRPLEKVASALDAANQLGLEFLWVDTCCINKSNSTELMESLACMGDWYANAKVCLVYLSDMVSTSFQDPGFDSVDKKLPEWSTRGWTLQEIAMCKEVVFYNASWTKIRHEDSSLEHVRKICNVPRELYCTGGKIDLSAAYVMHYAGIRGTSRGEDRAYSLMGMLGVKMPILYGEGEEVAISRLIDEVIRSKGDVSVFNWTGIDSGSSLLGKSMYPMRLKAFPNCAKGPPIISSVPVTMSNAGVNTTFEILPVYPVFEQLSFPRGLAGLLEEVAKQYPDIDCVVPCKGMLFWDTWEGFSKPFNVRCPLPILKGEAEYLRKADRPRTENEDVGSLPGSWVLARVLGTGKDNWFLCLLELAQGLGYVGWRIPSGEFSIKDRIIHPDHKIQICVR